MNRSYNVVPILVIVLMFISFTCSQILAQQKTGDIGEKVRSVKEIDKNYTSESERENKDKLAVPEEDITKGEQKFKPENMPIYVPPLRGAPGGRVAGGSRGVKSKLPYISVIAPDHVGLTVCSQPVLYWYTSSKISYPVEFTLIGDHDVKPLLETRIPSPSKAGIHKIRLSDYGVNLRRGKTYKWFVSLILDPNARSRDILSGGLVKFVEESGKLKEKLIKSEKSRVPHVYAEESIWYDSFSALSELIDTNPGNGFLRKQRAYLLKQVGLPQIAEYENGKGAQ